MADDGFGTIFGPWTLEQAVLTTLQTPPAGSTSPLIVYYLAELERQMGLTAQTLGQPPGPSSYRGGVDARTFEAEWFPMFHVIVEPTGEPVRLDFYDYAHHFQARIVATAGDDNEDTARMISSSYATAAAKLIIDNASLGIGATETRLVEISRPELLDPVNVRQVVQTAVTFDTLIAPVLTVSTPEPLPASPYTTPTPWPAASTPTVTFTASTQRTQVGNLSSALNPSSPITSLPVYPLTVAVPAGSVTVAYGWIQQTFTTTGAAVNATSIPVTSQTPTFAFPAGTLVFTGAAST